ncbi:MAG: hypothetical protein Q4C49_08505 [Bacillota bacterium]|nr:hypothetical protein [Bacillota bacterium]
MVKKFSYPLEAFALALVLFSSGMKEAMLVGIALIFGDVLISFLNERGQAIKNAAIIGSIVTAIAMAIMFVFTGAKLEAGIVLRIVVVSALLVKHALAHAQEEKDFDAMLFADSIAYAVFVAVSIIREYLSTSAIFKIALPKVAFCNSALGQTMYVLILGGIAVALLNSILKTEADEVSGLWVCVPAFVLETGVLFQNVLEADGQILGIVVVGILYLTYRYLVNKVNLPKVLSNAPIEMIILGVIYLVFSIL